MFLTVLSVVASVAAIWLAFYLVSFAVVAWLDS